MSSSNTNDPYGQVTLPYLPSLERTEPIFSQQQQTVFLPNTPRTGSSQNKAMDSSKASTSRRISKAEALTIVRRCKQWLIGGSLVSFGILTALVVSHTVGTTSTQPTPATNSQTVPAINSQAAPASNVLAPSSSSDGGFFQQQQQGGGYGGYGFGNSNTWQPPVSSSRVS